MCSGASGYIVRDILQRLVSLQNSRLLRVKYLELREVSGKDPRVGAKEAASSGSQRVGAY